MIIVRLRGGLGNQLFQYAAGFALARRVGRPLALDISGFDSDRHSRIYLLSQFNISPDDIFLQKVKSGRPWPWGRKFGKLSEEILCSDCMCSEFGHGGPIYQVSQDVLSGNVPPNVILDGYWQSSKYFQDCDDLIRNQFSLVKKIPSHKRDELSSIDINNSVCVGIRRYKEEGNKSSHHLLSPDYYKAAFELILKILKQPTFVVVCSTEDRNWAIENISFPGKTLWPTHQPSNEDAFMNLWLMSQFAFFVLANSTYHWWGAWLSKSPEKVVITSAKGWTSTNPHISNAHIL